MINSLLTEIVFFGTQLINKDNLIELILRFSLNFLILFCIVRIIYYSMRKRTDYLFSFFLFNTLVFSICILLNSVEVGIGFAFGLFAVFGILRYRTETIPIREMTYFFIVITIAVINGVTNQNVSLFELLFINLIILAITYILEKSINLQKRGHKKIVYEKIELIKPENRKQLIHDLKERTGLDIQKVKIGNINFLRDVADIEIYYKEDISLDVTNNHKLLPDDTNE